MQTEKRGIFDWVIFLLIHIIVIGAISVAGVYVYQWRLGLWVAASATVAGLASLYLFAKEVPGETFMKCVLYLFVTMNAAYLIHNGAQKIGVDAYNAKQVEKFQRGMEEAGKTTSRRIARELRLGAEAASKLEMALTDSVSVVVAVLAFLELFTALLIFGISSRRLKTEPTTVRQAERGTRILNPVRMPIARDLPHRRRVPGMAPAQARLEEPEGKDHRQ